MIIYSEILDKEFDTVDECIAAETEHEQKIKEREKAREEYRKKLDAAFDKAIKAIDEYLELAGVKVEEIENGYRVSQRITDEKADDIWDSIIATLESF